MAILDLDSLYDLTLDSVADIPDYVTPPPGVYLIKVNKAELEKLDGKDGKPPITRIAITMEVASTIETDVMPVADGSLFSNNYIYSDKGLEYFKSFARSFLNVSDMAGISLRDIFAALEQQPPVNTLLTNTTTKGKDGSAYTNVRMRFSHE